MACDERIMEGVREYAEEYPVSLTMHNGRLTIYAKNEGGFDCTQVDLLDLLEWLTNEGWIEILRGNWSSVDGQA